MGKIELIPVEGLPLIKQADDIGRLIIDALGNAGMELLNKDILVVAQKIVSKAEGRIVNLEELEVTAEASALAEKAGKGPGLVEAILRESKKILRHSEGLIIAEQKLGIVCANAGIDQSNVGGRGGLVALLPERPDESAEQIRRRIKALTGKEVAVIVNDSQGRAFRLGAVGIAIGVAGMRPILDLRGRKDLYAYTLRSTKVALADELASAASMLMGQCDEAIPAVVVRGLDYEPDSGSAKELLRNPEKDLFR